ncbi:PREDICTED: calcipressin-2-like [Branchiostoma belcheri]|uniref:Calcipressin-2-like n=1 Tax=Branchiostoma belcheri TaxID=7741 RepID=A0A6P4YZH7_BRABE|nr:PREDICTED: calcipressin-2-like [Branchiostoma belcheri]XP_019624211.1 PREDICTED: calcipressin-2-like [Branchiostoma belcheri]XP_019624212.1 PREDICTED: calcipressin-2-like [Branchiostoma belcheri]
MVLNKGDMDGTSNGAPNGDEMETEEELGPDAEEEVQEELPTALHVVNVPDELFGDLTVRNAFEGLFMAYSHRASFSYLKSFRRARVYFPTADEAARARVELHHKDFMEKELKVYFVQMDPPSRDPHLRPPTPEKQFLISPPASPPVDWEPITEQHHVNYDLLSALAQLSPGEPHELIPAEGDKPSIVIHVCEDTPEQRAMGLEKPRIVQTRRPDIPDIPDS